MGDLRMPSLGADMEHGTIVEWRVHPGDAVTRGQIVAVVDTEKADIEIEVFETGVIGEILVLEGVEVAVGTPLATIVPAAAPAAPIVPPVPIAPIAPTTPTPVPSTPPPAPAAVRHPAPHVRSPLIRRLADDLHVDLGRVEAEAADHVVHRADVERAARAPVPPAVPATARTVRASPRARRLAAAGRLDLAGLVVTHPDGALHAADVERALARAAAAPASRPAPAGRAAEAPRGQDAVARLMARSKREIPHYYLAHQIDLEDALVWCEARNASVPVERRVLPAALLLRAVVVACLAVPECNGHYLDGAFHAAAGVDLGIAVSTRDGALLAPVVPAADRRDLDDLMAAMRDAVACVRAGALRAEHATPASITVTSLGERGVDEVYGVIVPPQVAIVGFGAVTERPRVHDGAVCVRRCVTASLSADHRVSHGHRGARFLRAIADALARPEELA